ncbi:chaperonin 10-like protein [Pseudomassariella vexata]|uniref:Chaperonin 10-like protein n=1 Tax=Pseudomassariella vexata TaxID=1141098 RepID=A0A1Y2EGA9_9PEZI|nr:chaperonin 10-like protein [Pseudomassariella vexata]ORY70296.1 chaperonin 10-like protein [Pseudomassariella vexata]
MIMEREGGENAEAKETNACYEWRFAFPDRSLKMDDRLYLFIQLPCPGFSRANSKIQISSRSTSYIMRALRYHGQKDIRLEEIEEPQVKPGWVKIAPAFVGICGTDLHEYLGGNNLIPRPGHPHVLTKETSPLTLGHEFSGVIEEVGSGVSDLEPGQNVCVQPTLYCNECDPCKRGLQNCCDQGGFIGLSGFGGGLADHVVVPKSAVWKLPSNIDLELGALVEPLAVGYHAVEIAPIPHPIPSDLPILVLGSGPIGLAVIQAIIAQCSSRSFPPLIIVSEPSPTRQEFALDFGAHHVINPLRTDLVSSIQSMTRKEGVTVVFDCAGAQSGLEQAMKCVRVRGSVVNVAIWENKAQVNVNDVVFGERAYMGAATYDNGDFGRVLRAMEHGRIRPREMITRIIALEEVEEKGFRGLIKEKDRQVKILVDVTGRGRKDSGVGYLD